MRERAVVVDPDAEPLARLVQRPVDLLAAARLRGGAEFGEHRALDGGFDAVDLVVAELDAAQVGYEDVLHRLHSW